MHPSRQIYNHWQFTQLELPKSNLPLPLATQPVQLPPSIGIHSCTGTKHLSKGQNEDGACAFDITFDCTKLPAPFTSNLSSNEYTLRVVALIDGHGSNTSSTESEQGFSIPASPGALMTAFLCACLPDFISNLVHLNPSFVCQSTLPCVFPITHTCTFQQSYIDTLTHVLEHSRDLFNAYIVANKPFNLPFRVLDAAGCTLCFILKFPKGALCSTEPLILAINIGDSCMLVIDPNPTNPSIARVWPSSAITNPRCPSILKARNLNLISTTTIPIDIKGHLSPSLMLTSHEDTLAEPVPNKCDLVTSTLIKWDLIMLSKYLRRSANNLITLPPMIVVHEHRQRLRVANSVGNLVHHRAGALLPRSTVYQIWPPSSACQWQTWPAHALLVMVTDGVRDKICDTGIFVMLASALCAGREACSMFMDLSSKSCGPWSNTLSSDFTNSAQPDISDSVDPDAHRPVRTAKFVSALNAISQSFAPFSSPSSSALNAGSRLASILAEADSLTHEQVPQLLAESLALLSVVRGTEDDATSIVWRVSDNDDALDDTSNRDPISLNNHSEVSAFKWASVHASAIEAFVSLFPRT